jgi:hypothetical protein
MGGRVLDYFRFAIWLFGVGYVVLWPLIAADPIGTALICPSPPLAFLCHFPHPLTLPPGLQLIGVLSAGWVCLEVLFRLIARVQRAQERRSSAASVLSTRIPATVMRPPRRKPLSALPQVKPRSHFGLRGRPD